jgi:phospholipid-binding lipoprotein MlaA
VRATWIAMGLATTVAGCAAAPDPASLAFDPFEQENREVHEVNKQIDGAVYGPVARSYGTAVPAPVRKGISNFRDNWRLPGHVIQYALQGKPAKAAESTTRFVVNTVVGVGGIADPATAIGLPYDETNFDETFYVWGLPEGGYVELPFIGPGTQRDWIGYALDQALDPTYYVLPGAATTSLLVAGGLDIVNDRYELDTTLDTLLHDSADSYTAQRISYLQNMRARLQGGTDVDQLEDVYADF